MNEKTIPEFLGARVKKYAGKLLLQRKDGWSWKQVTWLDFDGEVKNVAAFLMSLGFRAGDRTLSISPYRGDALFAELAVNFLGGVVAAADLEADINEIARNFPPKFIFASDAEGASKALALPKECQPERIIALFDANLGEGEKIVPYKAAVKFGMLKRKQLQDELEKAAKSVSPESVAYIFPQNGGANSPRITQSELIERVYLASEKLNFADAESQVFSYLPSATPFEKLANLAALCRGMRLVAADSRKGFYEDILEVMPTVIFGTRVELEKLRGEIEATSRDLKSALGGRVKHIASDAMPSGELRSFLLKSGISVVALSDF